MNRVGFAGHQAGPKQHNALIAAHAPWWLIPRAVCVPHTQPFNKGRTEEERKEAEREVAEILDFLNRYVPVL